MDKKTGRCLCGEVSYEYTGPENWCGHCHCQSCRRTTASGFTTFMGVPNSAYRFTGKKPAIYRSSAGVKRSFCANCGTPIAYEAERFPDEIHFYLSTLDNPEALKPCFHVYCADKLSWIELADDLPKFEQGGGASS